jgi:predicted TIM-barrel fold metal-dependent hydrolase
LRDALTQPIGIAGTVADRTMFGTDWLMLSQVKRWADYPAALHASVLAIEPAAADRIFGANAAACFGLSRD